MYDYMLTQVYFQVKQRSSHSKDIYKYSKFPNAKGYTNIAPFQSYIKDKIITVKHLKGKIELQPMYYDFYHKKKKRVRGFFSISILEA